MRAEGTSTLSRKNKRNLSLSLTKIQKKETPSKISNANKFKEEAGAAFAEINC